MSDTRQAIITKTVGPTNNRGLRIQAKAYAGIKYFPWIDEKNPEENHIEAARLFSKGLDWDQYNGPLVTGSLPDADTYVHVFTEKE